MKKQLIPLVVVLLLVPSLVAFAAEDEREVSRNVFSLRRVQNPPLAQFLGLRNSSGLVLSAPGVRITIIQANFAILVAVTTPRPLASVEGVGSDGELLGKRFYYAEDSLVFVPVEVVSFADDGHLYGPEGRRYVEEYSGDGVLEGVENPFNGTLESSERVFERFRLRGPWVLEPSAEGDIARVRASSRSCVITLIARVGDLMPGQESVPRFKVVVGREGTRRVEEVSYEGTAPFTTSQRMIKLSLDVTLPGRYLGGNLTLRSRLFFVRETELKLVRGFYRYTPWQGPPPLSSTLSEEPTVPSKGEGVVTFRDALRPLCNMTPGGAYAIYSSLRSRRTIGERHFYGNRWGLGIGGRRAGLWHLESSFVSTRVVETGEESTPLIQQTTAGFQNTVSTMFVLLIVIVAILYFYMRRIRARRREPPQPLEPSRKRPPPVGGGLYFPRPPPHPPGRLPPRSGDGARRDFP